jgi:hypothetical protein
MARDAALRASEASMSAAMTRSGDASLRADKPAFIRAMTAVWRLE